MTIKHSPRSFMPTDVAARLLGVSRRWLRDQAIANALPWIEMNRRMLFDVEQVREALRERAREQCAQSK